MIQRPKYMNFLEEWKDQQIIKVVSGIRRCGKSTIFDLFREKLLSEGVKPEQIIFLNFEDVENEELCDHKALYKYIKSKMLPDCMNYIFLDEIQHVKQYEKAVDSLFAKKNTDVYITGSNAYFMSSELATLLSGRYVELKMLPLSFKEYVSAFNSPATHEELYRNYVYNSSFPYTVALNSHRNIQIYLDGLFNTVVLNDIVERKKIADPKMLKSVLRFMFDNIGNTCSAKKIADAMTSAGRKITSHTVENYLEGITDSLLMYRVGRYDIKGKEYLKLLEKYYLSDVGLRYYLLGTARVDQGHILENVVFLELLRRNMKVFIGKYGSAEVDFVTQDDEGNTEYYQVSWTVRDPKTLDCELASLNAIQDHNQKYLLTMDNDPPVSYNGIKQKYVLDWLLEDK
ncbi:MAG: ATP-binding protein [Solobacterium sp.]|jgi:predicted AAA+ superfamily ATPase|nr:ATP-binding protein [Solobacterium sp.]MCH4205455.1 ATP-binding protein [Solobacterium sp.]MCH4226667.1 ATP-binding protein [Solobacterium sp.]MCH4282142.1 ATP-binding protein [Solobacterium sp.]